MEAVAWQLVAPHQRWLDDMTIQKAYALVALLVLLIVCGCTSVEPVREEPGTSPGTTAPSQPRTVSFKKPYRHPDGVEIAVTKITMAKLLEGSSVEDPNAKIGDPYTILTVHVKNGSTEKLETSVTATCTYGPDAKPAPEVFVESGQSGTGTMLPGETGTYDWGFIVPAESQDQVVLKITVGPRRASAIFSGAIKPT